MNFEQTKAKAKRYRSLIFSSMFMIVAGMVLMGGTMWTIIAGISAFTMTTILFAGIGYAMSMAGAISIIVAQKNIRNLTKCVKCNRQLDYHDFINMPHFKCTNCGHEIH